MLFANARNVVAKANASSESASVPEKQEETTAEEDLRRIYEPNVKAEKTRYKNDKFYEYFYIM